MSDSPQEEREAVTEKSCRCPEAILSGRMLPNGQTEGEGSERNSPWTVRDGPVLTRSYQEKNMGSKERDREKGAEAAEDASPVKKVKRKDYEAKLDELHTELVKMQYWMKAT